MRDSLLHLLLHPLYGLGRDARALGTETSVQIPTLLQLHFGRGGHEEYETANRLVVCLTEQEYTDDMHDSQVRGSSLNYSDL